MKMAAWVGLVGTAGLVCPTLAFAQALSPPAPPASPDALSEVVVTARRVAEDQQKTPVTITTFGARDFQRLSITDSTDLSGLVPNVSITKTGAGTGAVQIFIRGIGQSALAFNLESPVATYVDDVYLGRIQGSLLNILNLQQVEVLRGPQGTLYGRNSTVGAVKYVTAAPDLESAHAIGQVTVGDYDRADINLYASAPLIKDELAVNVQAASLYQQGYIKLLNGAGQVVSHGDGVRTDTGRMNLLWKPTGGWRIDAAFDITNDHSGSSQGTPIGCNATGSVCNYTLGSPFVAGQNGANDGHNDSYGASLKVEHDLGWATVKSITSARNLRNFDAIDFSSLPGANTLLPDHKDQHQVSEEIQLISRQDQPLTWVGGFFFYEENIRHADNFVGIYINQDHQVANSYAGYLNGSYKITDKLSVEAGGRFSADTKDIGRTILSYPGQALLYTGFGSFSTTAFTYKVGLDYNILPNTLGYLTYSTGYRPGSFGETYPGPAQISTNSVLTHLNNETAKNVEVGLKNEFFEHRLRLNGDLFYTQYENLQTESSVSPYPVLSNNVDLSGVELEGEARPIPGLTLYGNGSYLYSDIKTGPGAGGRLQYAPKWKYAVGAEYRHLLFGDVNGFVGSHMVYTSSFTTDSPPVPTAQLLSVTQGDYVLVDGQVGVDFHDGRYRLSVDGKNLTDSRYFYGTSPGSEQFFGAPRMVSATLTVRY